MMNSSGNLFWELQNAFPYLKGAFICDITKFPNLPLPSQVAPNRMEQKEYYLAMQHHEIFQHLLLFDTVKLFGIYSEEGDNRILEAPFQHVVQNTDQLSQFIGVLT